MNYRNGGGSKGFELTGFILKVLLLFSLSGIALGAMEYTVLPDDTLYGISRKYGVPVSWIVRQNGIKGNVIHSGQKIDIPAGGMRPIRVRPGESLSSLADELEVDIDELRILNSLSSERISVGQVLKVPGIDAHRVSEGETLSMIAQRYGKSIEELRTLNEIEDDVIYSGQLVYLNKKRPVAHRVTKGDSLWSIASNYDVSMEDILVWNTLASNTIRVGEEIRLYPTIEEKALGWGRGEIRVALASLSPLEPQIFPRLKSDSANNAFNGNSGGIGESNGNGGNDHSSQVSLKSLLPQKGEYFFSTPRNRSQPNLMYWEGAEADAKEGFRRASQILAEYDGLIEKMGLMNRNLEGWHIVLDPGHGGLDPGAIVEVQDGNGNSLTVTEDEYVYDITVRLYRILKGYGASVSMTMLAPDHHLRNGQTAQRTFVNRKNEVYNDEDHNISAGWRPVGTAKGLDVRKNVARAQIQRTSRNAQKKGTLFLSIHADNSPDIPSGMAVLYDGAGKEELTASKNLAAGLVKYMGGRAFIRQQELRVLNDNPAGAAVLIEVRNIHYKSNAWALRSFRMREEDALRIAQSVAGWARNQ